MPKTITMRLSTASINKAARELREYAKELERKNALFLQRMGERGVEIAREEAPDDSGELKASIHYKIVGNVGYIICDAKSPFNPKGKKSKGQFPYPVAVEFGFQLTKPYIYYDMKNARFVTKKGKQPPNPFFQRTANKLRAEMPQIAREVYGRG